MNSTVFLGYIATVFVVCSFLFDNLTALRIVNSCGCFLFVIYGMMKQDKPIIVTNGAILLFNLYYLLFF